MFFRGLTVFVFFFAVYGLIRAFLSWRSFRHRDASLGEKKVSAKTGLGRNQLIWAGFWIGMALLVLARSMTDASTTFHPWLFFGLLLLALRHIFLAPLTFLELRESGFWSGIRVVPYADIHSFRFFVPEDKTLLHLLMVGPSIQLLYSLRDSNFPRADVEVFLESKGILNSWPENDSNQDFKSKTV